MSEELQELETERHPIRFLLKLTVFVALLYALGRFLADKKDEYAGLSESEARDKFVEKMAPRVGEDNATEIADQVIPKLKDRGLLNADGSSGEGAASDAANEVNEAVDSVVKEEKTS